MEQQYGRIVNIGSIYAERGCSDNSTYNVSKHGLLGPPARSRTSTRATESPQTSSTLPPLTAK